MAKDTIRCSFCNKRQEQVTRLIAGPNVYICNECVNLCNGILMDDLDLARTPEIRHKKTPHPPVGNIFITEQARHCTHIHP